MTDNGFICGVGYPAEVRPKECVGKLEFADSRSWLTGPVDERQFMEIHLRDHAVWDDIHSGARHVLRARP